jgi:uncharacterized RDD family membrane protein YckC
MNKNTTRSIDEYIDEIAKLLPYPTSLMTKLLAGLRIDVETAMEGSQDKYPSTVFGIPRDVAKNLSRGYDWGTKRAGWWSRIFAYLIDFTILGVFLIVYFFAGIIFILTLFVPIDEIPDLFQGFWGFDEPKPIQLDLSLGETIIFLTLLFSLVGSAIIVFSGYIIALERYFSATIGKKLLKLSVVDVSGIKITWYQAIVRNLSKILGGFLPVDLVLGMILERHSPDKTRKQRGLDILAETIVIKYNY